MPWLRLIKIQWYDIFLEAYVIYSLGGPDKHSWGVNFTNHLLMQVEYFAQLLSTNIQ